MHSILPTFIFVRQESVTVSKQILLTLTLSVQCFVTPVQRFIKIRQTVKSPVLGHRRTDGRGPNTKHYLNVYRKFSMRQESFPVTVPAQTSLRRQPTFGSILRLRNEQL